MYFRLIFGNLKNSATPQTVPNFYKNCVDTFVKLIKKEAKVKSLKK